MCGIAGIVSLRGEPFDPAALKRMCDVQAHRGPDDAGYAFFRPGIAGGDGGYWCCFADADFRHVNENLPVFGGPYCRDELSKQQFTLALGHRRLSIIDLSHYGHQPMASSDARYWISFNGEIYNFPDLRKELESRGCLFRTQSDTEVILQMWRTFGRESLERLDGMFAFALYDRAENALVLARDRFGVKPLYYALAEGHLLFASEVKGILASGLLPARIAPTALAEYFTFQNTYGRETLFERVCLLQPGEILEIAPGRGESPRISKYHRGFPLPEPGLIDHARAADEVADAFRAAVERQLISDVDVGSYLSGGMDSGSIVAVAGRSIPRLLTFTGGFDLTNVNGLEQGFDERRLAERLSYLMQTEHYDVVLHAGDMPAAMEKITWHMDDPRVGMCHPNWYAAKLASRFVKVCLAGAGGDELFGGYPWRYRQGLKATNFAEFDEHYFRYWHRMLSPEEMPALFVPELWKLGPKPRESFDQALADAPAWQPPLDLTENLLLRAFHFEWKTFLHGFLVTEDHISMAHSLETRVPFLDNALVDLAWRLPPSMKVDTARVSDGGEGPIASVDGKRILRRAMCRYLPEEFTRQHKQGFSPPDENWYRGPSMDYIKSILLDKRACERPWFNHQFVRQKLNEHFEGRRNHRLLIWSLLSFEWLQRHFIDRSVAAGTEPHAVVPFRGKPAQEAA